MSSVAMARFRSSLSIALHTAVNSFPPPTTGAGTEGGSILTWRDSSGYASVAADISMVANKACTMTGPVGLFGQRGGVNYFISLLNNGNDINFEGALAGFSQEIAIGGSFERLIVGGCTVSGSPPAAAVVPTSSGTVTVTATPLFTK